MICFNCGQHYTPDNYVAQQNEFCSIGCMNEDDARLVEGNGIIASALENNPQAFSDLNRIKLDVSGVVGQQLGNLIKFGREAQRHTTLQEENLD